MDDAPITVELDERHAVDEGSRTALHAALTTHVRERRPAETAADTASAWVRAALAAGVDRAPRP